MMTISWWLEAVIVIVIYIAVTCYVLGYRRVEKENETELVKKIIDAKAHVEIEKYRWDHPMDGGRKED